jgi:hypothetical protein
LRPQGFIYLVFFLNIVFGEIHVFNRSNGTESDIETLSGVSPLYLSIKDLAKSFSSKIYENEERKKLVIYINGHKIKVSGNSSFVIIDDVAYQMSQHAKVVSKDLYVPAEGFINIIKTTLLPGINFDSKKELLDIYVIKFNI